MHYEAQLATITKMEEMERRQNNLMKDMERRVMDKIDALPSKCPILGQVSTNTKEIDTLRRKSNIWDMLTGLVALVATGLGLRQ